MEAISLCWGLFLIYQGILLQISFIQKGIIQKVSHSFDPFFPHVTFFHIFFLLPLFYLLKSDKLYNESEDFFFVDMDA